MLYQHQSSAPRAKSLDADKLTLFFAIRVQSEMDRIARDVLYLLHDIGVPVLCEGPNKEF